LLRTRGAPQPQGAEQGTDGDADDPAQGFAPRHVRCQELGDFVEARFHGTTSE